PHFPGLASGRREGRRGMCPPVRSPPPGSGGQETRSLCAPIPRRGRRLYGKPKPAEMDVALEAPVVRQDRASGVLRAASARGLRDASAYTIRLARGAVTLPEEILVQPPAARLARTALLLLAFFGASARPAAASSLHGRVLDPQGNAIAGATVTVEGVGTGLRRETTTDALGAFTLPELPPAAYDLTTGAKGFAPRTEKGLALAVGQSYRLALSLSLAAVTETVETDASAPALVTAGSSTVDSVIGQTAIERLPLNGRNFMELAFLVPGNVPTPNFDPT